MPMGSSLFAGYCRLPIQHIITAVQLNEIQVWHQVVQNVMHYYALKFSVFGKIIVKFMVFVRSGINCGAMVSMLHFVPLHD